MQMFLIYLVFFFLFFFRLGRVDAADGAVAKFYVAKTTPLYISPYLLLIFVN